jgi:hypothetical protein
MVHKVKKVTMLDFLKAGFLSGAMEFVTPEMDVAEAKECVSYIRSYNNFDSAKVNHVLDQIKGDIGGIQVGREYSPVLYVHFPYWTGQKTGSHIRGSGGRIPDSVTQDSIAKAKRLFKGARADEIGLEGDASTSHTLRVWWD